jgi:hypothetical protein
MRKKMRKFDEACQKKFDESFERVNRTHRAAEEAINGDDAPWRRLVVISEDEKYLEETRRVFADRKDIELFALKPSEDPSKALSEGMVTVFATSLSVSMLELMLKFRPRKIIAVAPEGDDYEHLVGLLSKLGALLVDKAVAPEYLRMAI